MKNVIAASMCLASLTPLLAHDLYILPQSFRVAPGRSIAIELHNGDSFPESEGPPPTARLQNTRLLFQGGVADLTALHEEHKALVGTVPIPENGRGSIIVTATLSANSREYDVKKFIAYLEDEGLTAISGYHPSPGESTERIRELYSKYAKALLVAGAPSGFCTHPLGLTIEIVPAVDPATLRPGDKMPVQVLFQGKPMNGLTIETAWTTGGPAMGAVVGQTDADGNLSIPLQSGRCRITTGYTRRYKDQKVSDWETFFATLTFEVTPK
jgi:uncharacterized GH25 family protein